MGVKRSSCAEMWGVEENSRGWRIWLLCAVFRKFAVSLLSYMDWVLLQPDHDPWVVEGGKYMENKNMESRVRMMGNNTSRNHTDIVPNSRVDCQLHRRPGMSLRHNQLHLSI